MSTTALIAGFVAFSLAFFHLSLYLIFRSRAHLFLGMGWILNCGYLYLEHLAKHGLAQSIPFASSIPTLLLFQMAAYSLGGKSRRSLVLEAVGGVILTLVCLPFASSEPVASILRFEFLGGAIYSLFVFFRLSQRFALPTSELFAGLFPKSDASALAAEPEPEPAEEIAGDRKDRFFSPDPEAQKIIERAKMYFAVGCRFCRWGFLLFSALQLTYPLQPLLARERAAWLSPFVLAMLFKLLTAAGFIFAIAANVRLGEAKQRKAAVIEQLALLTAAVEHDLRQPISSLNRIAAALEERATSGDSRLADFLNDQSARLAQLRIRMLTVTEMIVVLRLTPEEFLQHSEVFALQGPVMRAVEDVKTLFREPHPVVNLDGFRGRFRISGSGLRLSQAFRNVLVNAIEASIESAPANQPKIWITSKREATGRSIEVRIRDEGPGIDSRIIGSIHEAGFSTKDSGRNPNRGMGLFISDKIVALHGGRLEFESVPGTGATAVFLLPTVD